MANLVEILVNKLLTSNETITSELEIWLCSNLVINSKSSFRLVECSRIGARTSLSHTAQSHVKFPVDAKIGLHGMPGL